MDDSFHAQRRSSLATVAFVLVLYVLGIGPMAALFARDALGYWEDAIVTLYAPLTWVFLNVPAIRTPLDAWIGLWENLL